MGWNYCASRSKNKPKTLFTLNLQNRETIAGSVHKYFKTA